MLSFEQCCIIFSSFPLLLAFDVGDQVLSFACSSPAGGMLFGVSGLLVLVLVLVLALVLVLVLALIYQSP